MTTGATITWVSDRIQTGADNQEGDQPNEEPRREPEVAKPAGRREDARQAGRVDLDVLGLAAGLRVGGVPVTA